MSHIQRRACIPSSLSNWIPKLNAMMSPDEIRYDQLSSIISRFANLRASLGNEHSTDMDNTLNLLFHIDSELTTWESSLPASWAYRTIPCSSDEKFYGTAYYIYPSYWNATVWREYCTIRMLVSDLLLTFLGNDLSFPIDNNSTKYRTHHRNTVHTLQKVCTDVCASAPYFLGRVNDSPMLNRSLGGYHFLWTVFVCACMPSISNSQKLWAIRQLESIGHDMGVHLALLLADHMRSKAKLIQLGQSKSLENLALYEYILKSLFTR
jgi:hypothetical protein